MRGLWLAIGYAVGPLIDGLPASVADPAGSSAGAAPLSLPPTQPTMDPGHDTLLALTSKMMDAKLESHFQALQRRDKH